MSTVPAIVLGGSGYVAGELLRLLTLHPNLQIHGVMSETYGGSPIASVFPNLRQAVGDQTFSAKEQLLESLPQGPVALFSAAPHGASAALVAEFLAASRGNMTAVDVSADFRFADAPSYEAIYGQPHGAPQLLGQFTHAVPEHLPNSDEPHVGHPGCFATALLLAAVPLLKLDLTDGALHASGITGSTGSGRSPGAGTHHPERHSNLFAYKPLAHRHSPEVAAICAELTGKKPELHFVPHSGPFARGIHMTVHTQLKQSMDTAQLQQQLREFYSGCEFIHVVDETPRIKNVVGSNYAHIGAASDGDSAVVLVAIDNLVKGAAGGAIQWMNRKLGFAEATGLTGPALSWI